MEENLKFPQSQRQIIKIRTTAHIYGFDRSNIFKIELSILTERVTAGLEFAAGVPPEKIRSDRFEAAKMMIYWTHGHKGFKRIIMRLHRSIEERKERKRRTHKKK